MADYYIIAAGGTGAMCVQAFLYMAAAGCAQSNATYHILLVDKDRESDAVTACINQLGAYEDMRTQLGSQFSIPEIRLHKWNFTDEIVDEYRQRTGNLMGDLSNLTLNKLLNPNHDPQIAILLETMYTHEELDTDLGKGFYGHPNIGAPVFDYVRERFLEAAVKMADGSIRKNSFMASLRTSLKSGKTHVYLLGSLFGGTGATVIPNVVLALRSLRDPDAPANCYGQTNLIMGGSVVMPYFKLPTCQSDSVEALEKVAPVDTKFAEQTREALFYYDESHLLSNMMNLMLVGSSDLAVTSENFSRGGIQHQHFHVVLMIAATAANKFFANNLGDMAAAVQATPVEPKGQLLLWKAAPADDKGNFNTLTPTELGLQAEYDKMVTFLRFSVEVGYYMRLKFDKDEESLKHEVEILGTVRQMRHNGQPIDPKKISNNAIIDCYKVPVSKAGSICKGFIEYFYDVSLSGYDWSKYYTYVQDKSTEKAVGNKLYYEYKQGAISPNAMSFFNERWVDLANLASLKELIDTTDVNNIMRTMTLNSITSYEMLDDGRPGFVETKFPHSIATIYEKDTLVQLGLRKNILGKMVKENVRFSEIYDKLYAQCQ